MTVEVNAAPAAAWAKLVDWEHMPDWDIFMDTLTFPGALSLGSKGRLKMKDGPTVDLVVTSFDPPNSYTDEFQLFFSRFVFHHTVTEGATPNTATVRIWVECDGLMASLLAPFMKMQFDKKMPTLMQNFKTQIET